MNTLRHPALNHPLYIGTKQPVQVSYRRKSYHPKNNSNFFVGQRTEQGFDNGKPGAAVVFSHVTFVENFGRIACARAFCCITMRLTPDAVLRAPQAQNCVGDRALVLRNRAIPAIENLAVARDSFDCIDLSVNAISMLGDGFPPFPRLGTLLLGANRITKIVRGVADSLPNLHTLILTANRITTREHLNIDELSRFRKLEVLSLLENPVSLDPELRLVLIHRIPSLTFFNFRRVRRAERVAALEKYGTRDVLMEDTDGKSSVDKSKVKKRKRKVVASKNAKDVSDAGSAMGNGVKTFIVGQLGEATEVQDERDTARKAKKVARPSLTSEEVERVTQMIANAKTVEEVTRLQSAIAKGDLSSAFTEQAAHPKQSDSEAVN